jgi:DEAD/DEAH box helicase domain-containing protein
VERPVEDLALDPANPEIRMAHLACAAAEAAVSPRDAAILGLHVVDDAEAAVELDPTRFAMTPAGLIWTGPEDPAAAVSLRSAGPEAVVLVDAATGDVLGDVERDRAPAAVHPGAVHLHLGERHVVRTLDLDGGTALLEPFRGDWFTVARATTTIRADEAEAEAPFGAWTAALGEAEVATRVIAYQRRRVDDLSVIDQRPLDLPERAYRTTALRLLARPDQDDDRPSLGALHAAEHLLAAALPLAVPCDQGDLAGVSSDLDADGGVEIILHETRPGGTGILRTAWPHLGRITRAALDMACGCPCERGCPSCVQRAGCPTLNEPLDKAGAIAVLAGLARP